MQRVTNCILINQDYVLLIKKPSRGWYAMPGGKMEQGETIKESVVREYWEETGLTLEKPTLAGVFTFNIYDEQQLENEWMMFTFVNRNYSGTLNDHCKEGELTWVRREEVLTLPMAEGDRKIFEYVLSGNKDVLFGAFQYTTAYKLLDFRLDPWEGVK
ncbi:8-oxo-dGTP diphosphatase [Virgibacillus soli]|uniref:8-oxo-dGTP diphosphatase n=1 Tax=Paracerasibacillus soli TaxID=480284 RepID=A0ABU5CR74_9BACI|nr:8-oxo-dGTP diphosphatase [Virgibacillus soli]MDY0408872.1 8-oxo-dGTP diphosphatase [Virgibacillus soli]